MNPNGLARFQEFGSCFEAATKQSLLQRYGVLAGSLAGSPPAGAGAGAGLLSPQPTMLTSKVLPITNVHIHATKRFMIRTSKKSS